VLIGLLSKPFVGTYLKVLRIIIWLSSAIIAVFYDFALGVANAYLTVLGSGIVV
jgi:hypothetical protein